MKITWTNYSHQYVKTKQSDEFHYHKLSWAQIIRHQQIIFQKNILRYITKNSHLYFDQTYYIYGEARHLELYTSTSKFPIEKFI